jgi:hypothetical protein
MSGMTV